MKDLVKFIEEVQDILSDAAYQCGKTVNYAEQIDSQDENFDNSEIVGQISNVYHQLCGTQTFLALVKREVEERIKHA